VLTHLATAVLRTTNLHHAIERRRAQNRSQREPEFGLGEGKEGVLIGLGLRNAKIAAAASNGNGGTGLVLEMELRRRSGRSVAETFVLVPGISSISKMPDATQAQTKRLEIVPSRLYLLSDHPAFLDPSEAGSAEGGGGGEDEPASTFNLGLTEKQRRDREGIVLPYFDAQTDIGAGEGGRILYDMGREDDFDEEDDEI
jgi:elongator complex protein 5